MVTRIGGTKSRSKVTFVSRKTIPKSEAGKHLTTSGYTWGNVKYVDTFGRGYLGGSAKMERKILAQRQADAEMKARMSELQARQQENIAKEKAETTTPQQYAEGYTKALDVPLSPVDISYKTFQSYPEAQVSKESVKQYQDRTKFKQDKPFLTPVKSGGDRTTTEFLSDRLLAPEYVRKTETKTRITGQDEIIFTKKGAEYVPKDTVIISTTDKITTKKDLVNKASLIARETKEKQVKDKPLWTVEPAKSFKEKLWTDVNKESSLINKGYVGLTSLMSETAERRTLASQTKNQWQEIGYAGAGVGLGITRAGYSLAFRPIQTGGEFIKMGWTALTSVATWNPQPLYEMGSEVRRDPYGTTGEFIGYGALTGAGIKVLKTVSPVRIRGAYKTARGDWTLDKTMGETVLPRSFKVEAGYGKGAKTIYSGEAWKSNIKQVSVQEGIRFKTPEKTTDSFKAEAYYDVLGKQYKTEAKITEVFYPTETGMEMRGTKVLKTSMIEGYNPAQAQVIQWKKASGQRTALYKNKPILDQPIYKKQLPKGWMGSFSPYNERISISQKYFNKISFGKGKQIPAHELAHLIDYRSGWQKGYDMWIEEPLKYRKEYGNWLKEMGYKKDSYAKEFYAREGERYIAKDLKIKYAFDIKSIKYAEPMKITTTGKPTTTVSKTYGIIKKVGDVGVGKYFTKTYTRTPKGEFNVKNFVENIKTQEMFRIKNQGKEISSSLVSGEISEIKGSSQIIKSRFAGMGKSISVGELGSGTYYKISSISEGKGTTRGIKAEPKQYEYTTGKTDDLWLGGTRGEYREIKRSSQLGYRTGTRLQQELVGDIKLEVESGRMTSIKSALELETLKTAPEFKGKTKGIYGVALEESALKSQYNLKSSNKSIQKSVSKTINKPITKPLYENKSLFKPLYDMKTIPDYKTDSKTKTMQESMTKTATKSVYDTGFFSTGEPVVPPTPPPTITGGSFFYVEPSRPAPKRKKRKGKRIKFEEQYTPSVEAQLFNIKGKPDKALARTGLTVRPLY